MLINALALFYPLLFIAISTMHENLYHKQYDSAMCTLVYLWHSHIVIALEGLYSRFIDMNNHINHLATYSNYASYSCMWHSNFVTCTSCSPVQEGIADLKPQCCSHPSDLLHKLLSLFLLQVQHIPVLEQSQGSD